MRGLRPRGLTPVGESSLGESPDETDSIYRGRRLATMVEER